MLGAAHPRRVQTYSISLSGTLDGTGTRWRASYRWQPEDTVTEVAPYAVDTAEPYLNLRLRQPIHLSRDGAGGIEALLDVRNLLAEGYRPYLLSDGSCWSLPRTSAASAAAWLLPSDCFPRIRLESPACTFRRLMPGRPEDCGGTPLCLYSCGTQLSPKRVK